MFEDTQALISSTTFQGAVISLVGFLVNVFKLPIATEEIGQAVSALAILIGIFITIYGRIKAKTAISGVFRK